MNKILISLSLMLLQILSNHVVLAETLTSDQTEINSLIKKMYAIDPDTFDNANFGAKIKNGVEIVSGKFDPDRQCKLLADFLVKDAVIKERKEPGCLTNYFRYPAVDDMELSISTRTAPLPKYVINTPVVNGNQAKVHLTLENAGDVFYYLKKNPEGWRIYKVESRESGGNEDHIEEGDMVHIFPPTPEKSRPSVNPSKCRTAICP